MTMRVAVLRGGLGGEHEVSMNSGSTVLTHLRALQESSAVEPVDVFIDRNGDWYVRGVKKNPEQILESIDVVWNALHGQYGEDGTVQRILDRLSVPYTGSTAYASALAMNKVLAKQELAKHGIVTPRSVVLQVSPDLHSQILSTFRSFPQPSVIKPVSSGSSVGVTIARSFNDFEQGIHEAFHHSPQVLIEELVQGKEATAGVVDRFRDQEFYALPPVEIIPSNTGGFFDYDAKYGGGTIERVPGNFSSRETQDLQSVAQIAHKTLGLRHYSRSDFILSPKGIYYLESNSLPGMTNESLLPKSLGAVGVALPEFISHILNLALNK